VLYSFEDITLDTETRELRRGGELLSIEPKVFDLLEHLIANRARYGYMGCPCRLLSDDRNADRDIICPCVYSVPDIAEYGSCYCNLYVSKEWNEGRTPRDYVPERRPPEKMPF